MPHRPSFAKHLSPAITLNGCKLPPGVSRASDGLRAPWVPEQGSSINTLGKATSSGSYIPAKTCTALTTIATLHNHEALGNKLPSPGGKCHRPGRCCGAGSGQGIVPAPQRIASPSDRLWMGSGLGEKPPPSIFKPQELCYPSPSSFSGSFLMNTPIKTKEITLKRSVLK